MRRRMVWIAVAVAAAVWFLFFRRKASAAVPSGTKSAPVATGGAPYQTGGALPRAVATAVPALVGLLSSPDGQSSLGTRPATSMPAGQIVNGYVPGYGDIGNSIQLVPDLFQEVAVMGSVTDGEGY